MSLLYLQQSTWCLAGIIASSNTLDSHHSTTRRSQHAHRFVYPARQEQESSPVKVPPGSCLDSSAMLQHLQQQLQQQQDELEAQAAAKGPERASVGCQTRQGDSWRVHSEGCTGKSGQESGRWAEHGVLHAFSKAHIKRKEERKGCAVRRHKASLCNHGMLHFRKHQFNVASCLITATSLICAFLQALLSKFVHTSC